MAGLVGDYVVLRLETRQREGEEEMEAGLGLSANHSAGSTSVSSAVFSLPLLLSCFLSLHPLTSASPVVVLQW